MLIACPNCTTAYQLDATALGARGRSVRCVRCRTVWFVAPAVQEQARETPSAAGEEEEAFRGELAGEAAVAELVADPPSPLEPAPAPSPDALVGPVAPPDPVAEPAMEPPPEVAPVALSDIPIPMEHAPPLAPVAGNPQPVIDNSAEDIESVARRRRVRARTQKARTSRKTQLPFLIGAMAMMCIALLVLRKDVVRYMPQVATFYASIGIPVNLRGLAFADLKLGRETHDGVPVLAVEGTIVNGVTGPVEVPRLRFALRNTAGAEVYAWTAVPSQSVLAPGARLPFRSRLASPPDDGAEVQVRFFTRRDAVAGLN
jgi:predicted Zn finger-like uncharacterized protein